MSFTLPPRPRRFLPSLFMLLVLCAGAVAQAQAPAQPEAQAASTDGEARSLFERGNESYARGEYAEAKRLFEAAYHLSKRPQLHYNVALAADHLRQDADALRGYRAYLEALPDARNRDEVRARIRVLEAARAQAAPAPAVATPTEAAKSVLVPAASSPAADHPPERTPLVRRWWVWTAAAVLVSGVAVGVVMATRDPGSERPLPGDNGLVVRALAVQP